MQLPDVTKTEAVADELMRSGRYSSQYCTYVATRTLDEITAAFARQKADMLALPTRFSSLATFHYEPLPGCGTGGCLEFQLTANGSYLIKNYQRRGMSF